MEEWGIAVYIPLDDEWFYYRASVVVEGKKPPSIDGVLNPHEYAYTSMTQEEAETMAKLLNASLNRRSS